MSHPPSIPSASTFSFADPQAVAEVLDIDLEALEWDVPGTQPQVVAREAAGDAGWRTQPAVHYVATRPVWN